MKTSLPLGLLLALVGAACASTREPPASPEERAKSAEVACIAAANRRAKPREAAPESIVVKHILVKHADAKNPVEGVTRTRGEACVRAAEARDKILAGASFDDMVAAISDEPGAATRDGSIGEVRAPDLDPAFANAAFDLDRQQMSDVVESPSGFHLIFRSE